MPLDEYRRKRDFSTTPEPAGAPEAPGAESLRFVIHKHAARALHYDLRLEIDGVFASWAVPKGPSLDVADKRLAVHVEDHPLEYGDFEGAIPAGEYGGGTVMIWDRGAFTPVNDPAEGVAHGDFKFVLEGTKLHGQWVLVRMKPRPGERQESWLLIKERDEHVRPRSEYDVLVELPDSAATGRSMEEIAASGEHPEPPAEQQRPDPFPIDAPLQLATLVTEAPDGDEWLHEVKYDGYRLRVAVESGRARTLTRAGQDWTDRFSAIAAAAASLPVQSALLDGEAVVTDGSGLSDFGLLQEAIASGRPDAIRYEAFDLLYLNGHDLRAEPLRRRKELLATLLDAAPANDTLHVVEHVVGHGADYHEAVCGLSLEGSVSKRGDRPWVGGRTRDWLKVKCLARQEFVIGGWTDPAGGREGFGALLLGVTDQDGTLRYAGRVGSGFTDRMLGLVRSRLDDLATDASPFLRPPRVAGVHWVMPQQVAEVAFREWTRDGLVRQAAFKGLRDDKDPRNIPREIVAIPVAEVPASDAAPTLSASGSSRTAGPPVVAGVTITNPTRVLQPAGVAKLDLARYYESVAPWMLPHVTNRLLSIVRCPHGTDETATCFYQKHPETRGWPGAFRSVQVEDKDGPATYFSIDDVGGLVGLAQLGTLEVHTWSSRADDPERPDRVVFDLDPGPGVEFADVIAVARLVRETLGALGLVSFLKTTGGRGLHVVAPLATERSFADVRAFSRAVVDLLAIDHPALVTGRMAKSERTGRVFIDYLRNAHGATAVCAYSTRARPGTPVGVPVTWDELDTIDPSSFDIGSVPVRLAALRSDPWEGYEGAATQLPTRF